MTVERTVEGLLVRLRPCGIGRFLSAAFLLFWLCGWVVGEGFALWLLVKGAHALATGTPPGPGRAPLPVGPALAMGAFLLLWLALWTFGGIAAMGELLRLLWGEDRIRARGDGLAVTWARGPFSRKREFPRDAIHRILLVYPRDALAIETPRETVELSRLGTAAERDEAARALRSELGVPERGLEPVVAALPRGWEEVITPEGERAVVTDSGIRRAQARVAWILAFGSVAVWAALVRAAVRDWKAIPLTVLASLAAAGLTWGALWLARGRTEWRLGSGAVTLRRRFGSKARDLFEARSLELVLSTDSDGDPWFYLEGVGSSASAAGRSPSKPLANRRRVASALRDPTIPRLLGAWLAQNAKVPFEDRTSRSDPDEDLARLRGQLEVSGPLGRWAARLIAKAQDQKRKSA